MDNRPKCISYSLFGYKKNSNSWLDFRSYLCGFYKNIRMARLIYPEWEIALHVDTDTYNELSDLFDNTPNVTVKHSPHDQFCKMMLWRLKPAFERNWDDTVRGYTNWKYSFVLCRDADSPLTYRERQAVQFWVNRGTKALHAITDSDGHSGTPLMGGMIGVVPDYFTERVGQTWDEMMALRHMDYSNKGSDQEFLTKAIFPKFEGRNESITQHYFNGFGLNQYIQGDYHTCAPHLCPPTRGHEPRCPNNVEIPIPHELIESNVVCGHIGAAGDYQTQMAAFLNKYADRFEDILEVERKYPELFYWAKEGKFF